jgi:hypothetical protein
MEEGDVSNERDDLTDRLLRKSLGRTAQAGPAAVGHVDAEVLAAWADGGLEPARASEVELHLSGCAECQAMISAFTATEPAPGDAIVPAVTPFWHRWAVRWAVPVAAGAIGVVIWSVVRVSPPAEVPLTETARVEEAAPAAPPSPFEMLPQSAAAPSGTAAALEADPLARPGPSIVGGGGRGAQAPAAPPRDERASGNRSQELRQERFAAPIVAPTETAKAAAPSVSVVDGIAPPVSSPPAPAAAPSAAAQSRLETTPVQEPRMLVMAERVTPVADAASPMFRTTANEAASRVVAEFSSGAIGAVVGNAAGRGGRGAQAAENSRVQVTAAPPPPPVRWRIFADGSVQRANVGSEQWEAIVIDPPAQLTTGVSPSPTVVWLAGRGGTVFRSTDGRTFTRVSSPAGVDLASVTAVSAVQATVTTADGRTFTTTDAGATWR